MSRLRLVAFASVWALVACGSAGGTDDQDPGASAAGSSSAGGGGGANAGSGGSSAGTAGSGGATAGSSGASAGAGGESAGGGGASAGSGGASAGNGGASAGAGGATAGAAGASGDPFGGGGTAGAAGTAGAGGGLPACDGPLATAEVFGHSGGQLFRVDPDTKAVTVVGNFKSCGGSVIDIAIDKAGNMFGTTFSTFVSIDKKTAACTQISSGSYPNSLSFVPAGTLDPAVEALVGYNGSTYVRIDPKTGKVSNVGSISGGYQSSGDIVSVIGGDTLLTVKGGAKSCADCIVRVNPKTGDIIGTPDPIPFGSVFGLAFWAGIAYGFTDGGEIFSYDTVTQATQTIPIPNKPSGLNFYGAGSTTCAPAHKPLSPVRGRSPARRCCSPRARCTAAPPASPRRRGRRSVAARRTCGRARAPARRRACSRRGRAGRGCR